jgi:hypothetical protein
MKMQVKLLYSEQQMETDNDKKAEVDVNDVMKEFNMDTYDEEVANSESRF